MIFEREFGRGGLEGTNNDALVMIGVEKKGRTVESKEGGKGGRKEGRKEGRKKGRKALKNVFLEEVEHMSCATFCNRY